MKTIRMTAISTEKARSRTQESAPQKLVRTNETGRASAGLGMGVGLSCILCYVIIDVFGMGSVADLHRTTRGQTGLPANFRQSQPEIHGSLVSTLGSVADLLQEGTKHGDGDGAFF